jgi:hypothetical protein
LHPPPFLVSLHWITIHSFRASSNILCIWYIDVIRQEASLRTDMRRGKIFAICIYSLVSI